MAEPKEESKEMSFNTAAWQDRLYNTATSAMGIMFSQKVLEEALANKPDPLPALYADRHDISRLACTPLSAGIVSSPVSRSPFGQKFWHRYEQRMERGQYIRAQTMLRRGDHWLRRRYISWTAGADVLRAWQN